ncbi:MULTISPECIES: hypothetical protein [unclassified Mesorhizobium]|nr:MULTISPECIES: hypothetical protein [unclassified Mesorhizobium]
MGGPAREGQRNDVVVPEDRADELDGAAIFLPSNAASFVTGQMLLSTAG